MRVFRRNEIWWVDFVDANGRRHRQSAETRSKTEALSVLAKKRIQVFEGTFFEKKQKQKILFKDLLVRLIDYQEKAGRKSTNSFFRSYARSLETTFGHLFLQEITPEKLEEFKLARSQEVKKATVNRAFAVLRRAFNLAIRWKLVDENPVSQIEFFREEKGRLRFLSKDEQVSLLFECKGKLRDLVLVALRTGLRKGELFGLRKGDIDFQRDQICLTVTKNGKGRQVPLPKDARAVLAGLALGKDNVAPLFGNGLGMPFVGFRKAFEKACRRAGLKGFRFHDLRHTYATDQIAAGNSIFTVSKFLGHSSIQTTMIYAHLAPEFAREEMNRYEFYLQAKVGTNLAQSA